MVRFLAGAALAAVDYAGVIALSGDRSLALACASLSAITVWFWAWGPISKQGVEAAHGPRD
jgi:hypothetical protein